MVSKSFQRNFDKIDKDSIQSTLPYGLRANSKIILNSISFSLFFFSKYTSFPSNILFTFYAVIRSLLILSLF